MTHFFLYSVGRNVVLLKAQERYKEEKKLTRKVYYYLPGALSISLECMGKEHDGDVGVTEVGAALDCTFIQETIDE